MSREELLKHHIYVPEVVDDRIKAHLLIGDQVLVWGSNKNYIMRRVLYKLCMVNPTAQKSNFMQFYLCEDEDLKHICLFEGHIFSPKYVMYDLFLTREDVNIIENMFYD